MRPYLRPASQVSPKGGRKGSATIDTAVNWNDDETEQENTESEFWTWVLLREVGTEIEAMLIAGRLHSAGVPAQVLSQVDSTRNFTVGALAIAKVYVPSPMLARAEEVLGGDDELPDMSSDPSDL